MIRLVLQYCKATGTFHIVQRYSSLIVGTRIHAQCEIWVVIIGVTEKFNYLHVYYSLPILCHCPTFCDRIMAYTSEVGITRYELRRTTVTPKILSPYGFLLYFAFVRATNKIQYDTGQKRCQMWDIFIKWDGIWCPCCGYRLRTKFRSGQSKRLVW